MSAVPRTMDGDLDIRRARGSLPRGRRPLVAGARRLGIPLLAVACAGFLSAEVLAQPAEDPCAADGLTQAVAQGAFGKTAVAQAESDATLTIPETPPGGSAGYCAIDVSRSEVVSVRVYPASQASVLVAGYEQGGAVGAPVRSLAAGAIYVTRYASGKHVLDEDVLLLPAGGSVAVINGLGSSTAASLSGLEMVARAVSAALAGGTGSTAPTTSPTSGAQTTASTSTASQTTSTAATSTTPSVTKALGTVTALSATSITAGGLTCSLPSYIPTADALDVGNAVRMQCVNGYVNQLTFTSLPRGPWVVVGRSAQAKGRVVVTGARVNSPILFAVEVTAHPATASQINFTSSCYSQGEQSSRTRTLASQQTPIIDLVQPSSTTPPYCFVEVTASKSAAASMTLTLLAQKAKP